MASVVWTCHTCEHNFGIIRKFTKYLMESCVLGFDQHFSFKYFLKIAFESFMPGDFVCLVRVGLTLSLLKIFLTSVVWTFDTYEHNLRINHRFTKDLKESCVLGTSSCLKIFLTSVVWTCHTIEYDFRINHKFTKYLMESCVGF